MCPVFKHTIVFLLNGKLPKNWCGEEKQKKDFCWAAVAQEEKRIIY